MEIALKKEPDLFLEYLHGDVTVLFKSLIKFNSFLYEMYNELNVDPKPILFSQIPKYDMGLTLGSITAKMFERYIYSLHPELEKSFNKLNVSIKHGKSQITLVKGIELGSAKYLFHIGGSAIESTFVSGGRCCNESPKQLFFTNGMDLDFTSCYGSGIRNLSFPIGCPHVLRNQEGGFVYSLRDF